MPRGSRFDGPAAPGAPAAVEQADGRVGTAASGLLLGGATEGEVETEVAVRDSVQGGLAWSGGQWVVDGEDCLSSVRRRSSGVSEPDGMAPSRLPAVAAMVV